MRTHVPDFWEDQKKAEAQMKREILFKAKHIHALPENEWMEGK